MHAHRVKANGITQHVVEWGDSAGDPILLLHGWLDQAISFKRVAEPLANAGFRVIAPDLRGYGQTDWAPEGSHYHFPDYVADVTALLETLQIETLHVIGHSMGGSVATLFTGIFPRRVKSLSLLEGVGMPRVPAEVGPTLLKGWILETEKIRSRGPRVMKGVEEAVFRMQRQHPYVDADVIEEMASHAVKPMEGGFVFRFDPIHNTPGPSRFDADAFEAFIQHITCPVLMLDGGRSDYPELVARAMQYPIKQHNSLQGAGHMLHWTRPAEVAACILTFLNGL